MKATSSKTTALCTALYGEVDRSVPFENGKEYEVKLNGVVYYTIAITLEYHKDRVQSEQDIKECFSSGLHWCGRIDISNHTEIALDEMKASNIIKPLLDGKTRVAFGIYTKKGQVGVDIALEKRDGNTEILLFIRGYGDVVSFVEERIDKELKVFLGDDGA